MRTCLIVDDSSVIRKVARRILEGLEFEIQEAEDGEQALDACRRQLPEAILLDWNMPVMSGIDLARALRAQAMGKRVPILMVTTRNVRDDVATAKAAGVNDYILKPFTPQVLKEKIDHILSSAAAPTA